MLSNVYLGEVEQFVLEASGLELRAVESNPGSAAATPGQEIDVHFVPEDAVILTD